MGTPASNKTPRRLSTFLGVVLAVAFDYFLPLAVALMDEKVFRTFFFSRTLHEGAGDWFKAFYPFLR
jgi:hypothetical protein